MASILYNIRYRGPYEYEKFILNAFQVYNDVHRITTDFSASQKKEILDKEKELKERIEDLIGAAEKNLKIKNEAIEFD